MKTATMLASLTLPLTTTSDGIVPSEFRTPIGTKTFNSVPASAFPTKVDRLAAKALANAIGPPALSASRGKGLVSEKIVQYSPDSKLTLYVVPPKTNPSTPVGKDAGPTSVAARADIGIDIAHIAVAKAI